MQETYSFCRFYSEIDMSEEIFVRHCSPTLAGMKAGSMFSCNFDSLEELQNYVSGLNEILNPKGIQVIILRYKDGFSLIGVFRIKAVKEVLLNEDAIKLLKSLGYNNFDLCSCFVHLLIRFQNFNDFPHEVGLFLGYPPEDVIGFIDNNSNGQKCIGVWKVYGDEHSAKKTFKKYRRCTKIYCYLLKKGRSIENLAVAS